MPDRFAGLVAEVLAGCQVPMSLGALGAAKAPLVELRRELGLTGWHTTEDAREAILRWYDDMENVVPAKGQASTVPAHELWTGKQDNESETRST